MKTKAETESEIYQFELAAENVCRLARQGNKYALRKLARVAVQLAQSMEELMKEDAPEHKAAVECWRPIFAGLPALPVLKHRHDGDLKQIQKRIGLLGVGNKLNYAKKGAKFNLYTPVNAYVSECLVHLQQVRDYLDSRLKFNHPSGRDKTPEIALARCTKNADGTGWLDEREVKIHVAAYKLPPLAKSAVLPNGQKTLADKWAHDVLVPLIELRESPLEDFASRMGWKIRPGKVKSDVRLKVAQCLGSLVASSTNMPGILELF